jgi:hypothetical protein
METAIASSGISTVELDYDFVEKQMILNRLCLPMKKRTTETETTTTVNAKTKKARSILPMDMINEVKSFCFYDIVTGDARKVRKNVNDLIKEAMSRANGYGGININSDVGSHWSFGFTHNNERLQLQAVNCFRCGNYLIFNGIHNNHYQNLNNIICQCPVHGGYIIQDEYNDHNYYN